MPKKANSRLILETKNIKKSYKIGDLEIHALRGISLEIYEGEYIAIVGKSGSGKSTLMHLIGLLDTPTTGQILLNQKDVSNLSQKELARIRNAEIGFVFQSFNLLQRTSVLDNVILPLKYSTIPKSEWEQRAVEAIKLVGLEDRMYNKSNELSGGQKQRVAIARALINDPSIILADEPTGNLDTKTGDEIVKLFHQLHDQGKTIIIVTHDDDLAEIAKRKIVLQDGEVANK